MTHMTKQQLFFEIERLPNTSIAELQSFIQYLKFKQVRSDSLSTEHHAHLPGQDPILQALGTIDVTPFSDTIDDTLYTTL